MAKPTVGIIYDTSYLMLDKPVCLGKELGDLNFAPGWFGGGPLKVRDRFKIVEIVPLEVAEEIRGHFADSEKSQSAKRARKMVADLIDHGAEEVKLAEAAQMSVSDPLLGADSETDRLLLGYALSMVGTRWCFAIVATDDGGILYDAVKLRKAGKLIHCHTKERWRDMKQVHEFLANAIKQIASPSGFGVEQYSQFK